MGYSGTIIRDPVIVVKAATDRRQSHRRNRKTSSFYTLVWRF